MSRLQRKRKLHNAYRSGLEKRVGGDLDDRKVKYLYEPFRIPFTQPEKARNYTPDFVLDNGIIIETKGEFKVADRMKHLMIRESNPTLDIRFVFCNPKNKISKRSKTSYADWCDKNNFRWSAEPVPQEWINE